MMKHLNITYRMRQPSKSAEGNVTVPMTPENAEIVLEGNPIHALHCMLCMLAELQGYDNAEVCTVQEIN